jgi:serine/threonine-protein kinase
LFPQIFGKYVLERLIAVGGMARVFLATLRGAGGFEKKLVVKQIRAELATDEAFVRRFVAEAKTTVELSHPNIVPVYELGVEQGVYYLAMELCDGVTLAELVEKTGKLSPSEGAYVGIEICRALDYAHRRARIIHRDVTPRNVIVDDEGAIRLIDFGIAAPAHAGAKEIFGSPGHMPPEQIKGGRLGPPTDVFAVATLLYEAWSSSAPFRRATPEASERALEEKVPPISTIDASLAPLDDLISSSLSIDAAARPQSAEDLSRPLRRFVADADLGDLAKRLGARVARLRGSSQDAIDETDATSERPSSPDVTRTFATRQLESSDESPAPDPPDVATRRMNQEAAGWSTGKGAARTKRGALWASAALLIAAAAAAAAATMGRPRPIERPSNANDAPSPTRAPVTDAAPATTEGAEAGASPTMDPLPGTSTATEASSPTTIEPVARNAGEPPGDAPAHFRILANPQATVEIDGKPRGTAPIADLVVGPGTHRIRLDCAPLGEAVSQNVRVGPGESVTVSGDFTGAHGRVLVRRASGTNP